jgi:multiple sugar transport system permease protein
MLKRDAGDRCFSLVLLAPAILITTVFILIPVADSILKSFLDYRVRNIISGMPGRWNNFANYIRLFQNSKLLPAVEITFGFVLLVVISQFVFGMILALVLNSRVKAARFLRSVMMIPWVVPTVISALIWMWIYQPQYGLLKYLAQVLSGGRVSDLAMLNRPVLAMFGIAIAALWKQIPLTTLLFLAGLQNVPDDILEAATVDGADSRVRLFRIILPCMKSVIKVALSMAIIENFKQFPLVWTMTGGGPNNATTTLAILSYREAFISNNLGSGAAVTTLWMLLMVIVVFVYNRLMGLGPADSY